MRSVTVQVSVGELLDKLVILEIKAQRIPVETQQHNIRTELRLLQQSFADLGLNPDGLDVLLDDLRRVNAELWQIEDDIRECERQQQFGDEFIALARSVYVKNDARAALKRRINDLCGSDLREEKYYTQYARVETATKNHNTHDSLCAVEQELERAYGHWSAGQQDQAELLCRKVLAVWPDNAGALHLLGLMAHTEGNLDLAIDYLRRACRSPRAPGVYFSNLAEMCRQKKMLGEGEAMARRAVALAPAFAGGWNNLGIILQEAGNYAESLACLERVVSLQPDSAQAHNNLGNTLKKMGQPGRARSCYTQAIALSPNYAEAHSNLSHLLKELGELDKARAEAREAVELNPRLSAKKGSAHHWKQRAAALYQQGRFEEARDVLSELVDAMPGDLATRFDLAETLLMLGEFERGWREYQYRYSLPHTTSRKRKVQAPRWDGRAIPGRTLFIHDEQGFGDTFQFMRMLPWVKERSGAKIILEVHPEILPFAERMGCADHIIPRGTLPPPFDVHSEMMSLPHALNLKPSDLPGAMPYLKADAGRVDYWRKRLEKLPRPLVGLFWSGKATPNPHRSMPLGTLAPLAMEDVTFLSLQKGPEAADARTPPVGMKLIDLSEENKNFDDSAAIMTVADLIISIDSSPVHLAGALGRPAWAMLLNIPDWRWSYQGEDCPWYPTLRLFRQPAQHDWKSVVDNVAAELKLRFQR